MVAHDAKTGARTTPVRRGADGTFPDDPQINPPDRNVIPKPAVVQSGHAAGGSTQPSEGQSSAPTYTDIDGNPSTAEKVLAPDLARKAARKGKVAAAAAADARADTGYATPVNAKAAPAKSTRGRTVPAPPPPDPVGNADPAGINAADVATKG